MTDGPREAPQPDELSPAERRAFDALPREAEVPADLEDRVVAQLRQRGQLPIPLASRRRAEAPRRWLVPAAAAAAAVLIFGSGMAAGQFLADRNMATALTAHAAVTATEAAAHVRRAGDLYVASLASFNSMRDTSDVQGRELARKFALAALGAAAEEVAHIAPDDPLAAAVLRGLNQRSRPQGPEAPSRSVVWY